MTADPRRAARVAMVVTVEVAHDFLRFTAIDAASASAVPAARHDEG
jgi:hypothetical protein